MQIEIATRAYAHNANFNAIADAILAAGYSCRVQLSTSTEREGVTITTDAPRKFFEDVKFTPSAVKFFE